MQLSFFSPTALNRNIFLAGISLQDFIWLHSLCIVLKLLVRDAHNLSLSAVHAYSNSDIFTDFKKLVPGQNLAVH